MAFGATPTLAQSIEIPFIGVEAMSMWGLLAIFGILLTVAFFWQPMNQLPIINAIPKQYQAIGGITLILIAAFAAGAWSGIDTTTEDKTIETMDAYSTTDAEVFSYNDETGSTIDGDVHFYDTGETDEDLVKGNADLLRTATTSSGEATMSGWDTEKYPQASAVVDISGFYQEISNEDFRVEKDADDNTKSFVFRGTDLGDVDETNTATSPSISAGSESSLTIFYGNSETDSEIRQPAIMFDNSVNTTLESVDDGGQMETVDDTDYVVPDDSTIEGDAYETVSVTISVDSGAGEATWDWTYNDLFGQYGSDDFTSDSDIRSVTSVEQSVAVSGL